MKQIQLTVSIQPILTINQRCLYNVFSCKTHMNNGIISTVISGFMAKGDLALYQLVPPLAPKWRSGADLRPRHRRNISRADSCKIAGTWYLLSGNLS
jgi:hypothetical protein